MYFENEKHHARQRSNDEFLRRIRSDQFAKITAERDVPTLARMDLPGRNAQMSPSCDEGDGSPQKPTMPRPSMSSLAMVYAPMQAWSGILSPEEALAGGSLFADLILPFEGDCGKDYCNVEGGFGR